MTDSPPPLRVVFFGTPLFAVPTLEALIACDVTDVVGVVCQPDRPRGRGRRLTPPEIKVLAEQHGIAVMQPEKLRGTGFAAKVASLRPDVAVVAAYGKILPPDLLDVPRHGCINVHASLLPRHRGAAPIQWTLIRGDAEAGVTIMQMDEGCDTGPIIAQDRCDVLDDDDAQSLSDMISVLGAKLLVEQMEILHRADALASTPQDDAQATKAPLLKKEDGLIDWTRPAREIACLIRGVTPWPGAQTALGEKTIKILQADPIPAHHPDAEPGEVVELDPRRGFVVATGKEEHLLVRRVQPPGKAAMSAADAAKGRLLKEGDRLGQPA